MDEMLKIVMVEPGKPAYAAEIPNTLEAEQKAVQGLIDLVYLEDDTILVCNDEGKLIGMEGNRRLGNGTVIAGPFFIVGDGGENFCSLTDDQVNHFLERFAEPEQIPQAEVQADVGFLFFTF